MTSSQETGGAVTAEEISKRNNAIRSAFEDGRAVRVFDTNNRCYWNAHKIASDKHPTDDVLFEAFMQGWDAGLTDVPK